MRVLILDTQAIRRGAQVFGLDLQHWLTDHGHECSRLYLYAAEEAETLPVLATDSVLNRHSGRWLERVLTVDPRLLSEAKLWISDYKPDLVLLNGSSTVRYGTWLRLRLSGQIRWVARVIGDVSYGLGRMSAWRALLYRVLGTYSAAGLDGVVAVGRQALDRYRAAYQYRGDAVVIPRAVDVCHFSQPSDRWTGHNNMGIASGERVLMFVGNLSHEKRPDRFIRVFAAVARQFPSARAWIVGDGPLRSMCEALAVELGVGRQTEFFGYQPDVRPYLASADALFLSSDTEGLPGVALEAACMGAPVVATRVGDVEACVRDGETGFVVEPRDEQAACNAIAKLFRDSDLARKMGAAGVDHIRAHFSMDKIGAAYEQYFRFILNSRISS